MKSKPILFVSIIIGLVIFFMVRLSCNRRDEKKREPGATPQVQIPAAQAVAGTYEMLDESNYMQATMVIRAVSRDEASFDIQGVSQENRTAGLAASGLMYKTLIWEDPEAACTVRIDFRKERATVRNDCTDCCAYDVSLSGDYDLGQGTSDTDPLAGAYHMVNNDDMSATLTVTAEGGDQYSFHITGTGADGGEGEIAGSDQAWTSLLWRDPDEDCGVVILFGDGTASVDNTCDYCCQWHAYVSGGYQKK